MVDFKNALEEIRQRVTRIESRVVIGFEAMGVDMGTDRPRVVIHDGKATVYTPSRHTALSAILNALPKGYMGHVVVSCKEHEIGRFVL